MGLHVSGKSICEISKMLKIPKSTVQYTIVRHSDSDDMQSAPRSGRPKSLNKENQKKLQKIVDKNNRSSIDQIQEKFIKKSGIEVSTRTI